MSREPRTAWLANIRLHPIKALNPVGVPEARIGPNGGLELDRVWALFSAHDESTPSRSHRSLINGKRTAAIHHILAEYDPGVTMVTLSVSADSPEHRGSNTTRFAFPSDYERAASWFSDYFGEKVIVRYIPEGVPDDGLATGPTIVATASLQAVCDLFPEIDLHQTRERFRSTLEIDGVPAFWEDQLFGEDENYAVRFKIGDVAFEGSNPCARCPVPPRNPRTGEDLIGFQKKFADMRRASLPDFSPSTRFDHFYRMATNTRIPGTEQGKLLRVGDALVL
jgi:uncharacterized protein